MADRCQPPSPGLPHRQRRAADAAQRGGRSARIAAPPGQARAGRGQGMRAPAHLAMEP